MKNVPAFTLIELLVAITIISVMSVMVVADFRGAKERQEVGVLADQGLALLQQSHANVRSGKVEEEDYLCEGAFFMQGELVQYGSMPHVDGACDFGSIVKEPYGLYTGLAEVGEATVGEVEVDPLWVLFEPPNGDVAFYDNFANPYVGDAVVSFVHPRSDFLRTELLISYLTNQVSLTVANE